MIPFIQGSRLCSSLFFPSKVRGRRGEDKHCEEEFAASRVWYQRCTGGLTMGSGYLVFRAAQLFCPRALCSSAALLWSWLASATTVELKNTGISMRHSGAIWHDLACSLSPPCFLVIKVGPPQIILFIGALLPPVFRFDATRIRSICCLFAVRFGADDFEPIHFLSVLIPWNG